MLNSLYRLNQLKGFSPHLSRIRLSTSANLKMSVIEKLNLPTNDSLKRVQELNHNEDDSAPKKACVETDGTKNEFKRLKIKKIAMLVVYSGQGYLGLQRNPGRKTIEEELMVALFKSKLISEEVFNQPQLIQFQRAARTDKGVSAIRQILSMKLSEDAKVEDINVHLPPQIRAVAIRRVTKGFNCKSACDARTYSYMTPTFAFAPHGESITEDYRVSSEIIKRVNEVLSVYVGTHNYHNFTSRRLPMDPSSIRYMINLVCGEPFMMGDMEFAIIKVKGQSFMLHQIRKMVGLMISIVRGLTTIDIINRAWEVDKLDLPIAPGLGLLLEEVHYDRYNKRYGTDGIHEPLEWSAYEEEIEEFKKKFILPTIVEAEKNEKSMISWLETLHLHSFDIRTKHLHSVTDELDEEDEDTKNIDPVKENSDSILESAVNSSSETCNKEKEKNDVSNTNQDEEEKVKIHS